jgi:hypothetical protein
MAILSRQGGWDVAFDRSNHRRKTALNQQEGQPRGNMVQRRLIMMKRKLACILTAVSLLGAVTPASAQYFFAGSGGVAVGVGPEPYFGYSSWWGGPGYSGYTYADPGYAYADSGYAYSGSWWGGAGYAYGSDWWGGGGGAYAYAPAPTYSCRIVTTRHQLRDGRMVVRRTRSC